MPPVASEAPTAPRKSDVFFDFIQSVFYAPARFVREKVVDPNRGEEYPWYHKRYQRVPTIDECYMEDLVCRTEADLQYKRDRQVEANIVSLLRRRYEDCLLYDYPDQNDKNGMCEKIWVRTYACSSILFGLGAKLEASVETMFWTFGSQRWILDIMG